MIGHVFSGGRIGDRLSALFMNMRRRAPSSSSVRPSGETGPWTWRRIISLQAMGLADYGLAPGSSLVKAFLTPSSRIEICRKRCLITSSDPRMVFTGVAPYLKDRCFFWSWSCRRFPAKELLSGPSDRDVRLTSTERPSAWHVREPRSGRHDLCATRLALNSCVMHVSPLVADACSDRGHGAEPLWRKHCIAGSQGCVGVIPAQKLRTPASPAGRKPVEHAGCRSSRVMRYG